MRFTTEAGEICVNADYLKLVENSLGDNIVLRYNQKVKDLALFFEDKCTMILLLPIRTD